MKIFINTNKKLLSIVLICLLALMCAKTNIVYASTESKNLKSLLEKHEEDLGDLRQLKVVVDMIHEDLYSATKVNNSLKQKLSSDIGEFNNIVGVNPLIKTSISTELKTQMRDLSDENLDETKEDISAIKEWVDYKVGDTLDVSNSDEDDLNDDSEDDLDNDDEEPIDDTEESPDDVNEEEPNDDEDNLDEGSSDDDIDDVDQKSSIVDKSLSGQNLPKAGIKSTIIAIAIILLGGALFFVIRYRQLRDID